MSAVIGRAIAVAGTAALFASLVYAVMFVMGAPA